MENGRVYWITGLSNSGKTTIGTTLYYELRKEKSNVVILDGDLMKEIASGTEEAFYSVSDRLIRAKRYSKMAKLLSDQGIWVIVCAIAMFDEVREWNRKNIKGYIEIFLNPSKETLRTRDRKGLFLEKNDEIELPKNPDIIFENNDDEPIREIVSKIQKLIPQKEEDYDRDKAYWNSYYQNMAGEKNEPSNFAKEVEPMLVRKSKILELGCGNGRDSLFFLERGHNVTAVDGSDTAIEMLNKMTKENKDALFVCDNFVKCHSLYQRKYDCIYSRFTLHAITEEQENELLKHVKLALNSHGMFCIEARTVHDDIYGKGKEVGRNAFIYNDHYRRFIDVEEFKDKLVSMGFEIISILEEKGFSKTEDSDPVLMRCIGSIE